MEFIIRAAWAAQSDPPQPENASEWGKEHFDLLSEPHRDDILFGFGDVAGNLTGVFMFFAGD